jgi:hypothetical protein
MDFEFDGSMKESNSNLSGKRYWNFKSLWNNELGSGVRGEIYLVFMVSGWEELDFLLSLFLEFWRKPIYVIVACSFQIVKER